VCILRFVDSLHVLILRFSDSLHVLLLTILRLSELLGAGKVLEYEWFGRVGRVFSLHFKVTEDYIAYCRISNSSVKGLFLGCDMAVHPI
jgi:hypothetical protein